MDKIIIDGREYVPATTEATPIRIVVLQRGWVVIGRYNLNRDTNEVALTNAATIRIWGTTKGLMEIALGPTAKTVLDKSEFPIRFNAATEIFTIDCSDKWNVHL